ncbi:MAG: outer membrane lipoprotein carrier protein LolA [Phycisphaerae bacterium]|nr:outer membrane lipoprotein carrier protein LolA [Phycisphaerae bacterium]
MKRFFLAVTVLIMPAACISENQATSQPATVSATNEAAGSDSAVMKILSRLEKAGQKYATLKANVDYKVEMRQIGDSEQRTGWVAFAKGTDEEPAKFRIYFDTLRLGEGKKIRDKVDYAFDGQWLTVARHRIREMTRYQVAAKGEKIEPLKLGEGPFPVPFGQKTDDVLKYCEATTRETTDGEPKNTDYIKLVPRREFGKEMKFTELEMWIDRTKGLPVQIVSRDKNKDVTTVVFKGIKTDVKLDKDVFYLPRKLGWQYHIKPLE